MAHPQQAEFCQKVKKLLPEYFKDKKVLDVGSLDVNGNNRYLFENCEYTGLDISEGKNVDVVCLAHKFDAPDCYFDTIISTECFEHDPYFALSLQNIVRLLKSDGLFLFTCATEGRKEHGTSKNEIWASPLTAVTEGFKDYYKNLTEEDIRTAIDIDKHFSKFEFEVNEESKDLYFYGVRKSDINNKIITEQSIELKIRPGTWDEQISKWIYNEYKRAFDLPINGLPIIDIGAHIGSFSKLAAKTYPLSKIYCYEPDESSYRLLEENMSELNCSLHKAGVSGEKKLGKLIQTGMSYQNRVFIEPCLNKVVWRDAPSKGVWCSNLKTIKCIPINSILDELDEIGLFKMDCEGSEFNILSHLSEKNKQNIQFIVGEIHIDQKETQNFTSSDNSSDIIRQFFRNFKIIIEDRNFFGWRKDIKY